jgi:hypothetical protein
VFTKTIALGLALLAGPSLLAQQYPIDLLWSAFPPSSNLNDSDNSRDIELADLDGDGDLDCIVANLDEHNAMYLNDGFGNLRREYTAPLTNDRGNSRGITLADIDNDGDVDVFIANSVNEKNFLYENQGGSPLVWLKRTNGPVTNDIGNSRQAAFVDVDNDGDQDLFVTNFNDVDNWLYINQGGAQNGTVGRFARHLTGDAVTDGGSSYGVAFGDIDADGDQDLFVTNHSGVLGGSGARNHLYFNDGTGEFTASTVGLQSVDVKNSLACAFADMDNDGDQDLFVGNGVAQHNQVFLNDGSGLFDKRPKSDLTTDRGRSIGSVWVDFDEDGDMDVVVANRSPNLTSEMFINTGNAEFTRQTFGPLSQNRKDTYDAVAGDLDLDGHADLMLANYGSVNDQFRNHGRQWKDLGSFLAGGLGTPTLSGSGNCMPSTDVRFKVSAVPDNSTAYLVVGTNIASTSFLGGILVVDPAGILRVFSSENTGTENIVDFIAHVPPAGLPSGVRIVFQAWISDPGGPSGYSATNGLRVMTP